MHCKVGFIVFGVEMTHLLEDQISGLDYSNWTEVLGLVFLLLIFLVLCALLIFTFRKINSFKLPNSFFIKLNSIPFTKMGWPRFIPALLVIPIFVPLLHWAMFAWIYYLNSVFEVDTPNQDAEYHFDFGDFSTAESIGWHLEILVQTALYTVFGIAALVRIFIPGWQAVSKAIEPNLSQAMVNILKLYPFLLLAFLAWYVCFPHVLGPG